MAIFNSYVSLPEGIPLYNIPRFSHDFPRAFPWITRHQAASATRHKGAEQRRERRAGAKIAELLVLLTAVDLTAVPTRPGNLTWFNGGLMEV